jgi:restriction endonuclease Mrr
MIPSRDILVRTVEEALVKMRVAHVSQIYDYVAKKHNLSEYDKGLCDSNGDPVYKHEVRWCLQTLKQRGVVQRGKSLGYWELA